MAWNVEETRQPNSAATRQEKRAFLNYHSEIDEENILGGESVECHEEVFPQVAAVVEVRVLRLLLACSIRSWWKVCIKPGSAKARQSLPCQPSAARTALPRHTHTNCAHTVRPR